MISEFLISRFVPEHANVDNPAVRLGYGTFCGWVGIAVNVLLAALKFTVGILSGSVAISADAVNNLADAGSAVVTICGFKLAAKPADHDHPFGHGRLEYVAGVVVAVAVIAMGLNFLKESVMHIIHPEEVKMSAVLAGLVAGSLLFKAWLFFFYRCAGRRIDSATLHAAAFDSLSDLAGTLVVLLALGVSKYTTFPVDGCAGVLVAGLVLFGGWKILRETIDPLLGKPPSRKLVEELRERLLKCEGIRGVHDIIMHNYGPNQYFATAHAEVGEQHDILAVHDLLERAEAEIGRYMPVHLLLHCDPCDAGDPDLRMWQGRLENAAVELDPQYKIYDLRWKNGAEKTALTFHLLVPQNCDIDDAAAAKRLGAALKKYPGVPELYPGIVRSYV